MFGKICHFSLVSERLLAGAWGWVQSPAPQYSDSRRCRVANRKVHFHNLHTHYLESYRARSRSHLWFLKPGEQVCDQPLHRTSYTHLSSESLKEIGQHPSIPFWLPGPLIVFAVLRDYQHNFTLTATWQATLSFISWHQMTYLIPGSLIFTVSPLGMRKVVPFEGICKSKDTAVLSWHLLAIDM